MQATNFRLKAELRTFHRVSSTPGPLLKHAIENVERDVLAACLLIHRGGYIDIFSAACFRRHHIDLRCYDLLAKLELIDRGRARSHLFDLLASAVEQSLARADGRAHRALARRRAVITHVALHHQLEFGLHLWHAEWTGQHTVVAGDAPRLPRGLHYAIIGALDCVGRTYFSACWRVTMHAHHRRSLHRMRAIEILQVNHRVAFMRVAFAARLRARLTPDASSRVDEKFHVSCDWHTLK